MPSTPQPQAATATGHEHARSPLDVLVVDDDPGILTTLRLALAAAGCPVRTAASAEEALALLAEHPADLLLTDVRMEGASGIDLVRETRALLPDALCVVMTAFASFENAVAAIKAGAFDYLPKPFSVEQLEHLVGKVATVVTLRRENARLRAAGAPDAAGAGGDWFAGLTAPATLALQTLVERIAPSEATVLLTGETGTGKTALARAIHARSARAGRPFVEVTCTALAESLFESEVFGHVRGAFTGAVRDHAGKFELAEGGTLFLDEVGELSPASQAKLLRFLEDRVIERVGGTRPLRLDVRIIAATNRDLARLCREGAFREDLYYRLNVFECVVPPLRDRPDDIAPLAAKLFRAASVRLGVETSVGPDAEGHPGTPDTGEGLAPLPQAVLHALLTHRWPGNVRELRNAMERMALLAAGRQPGLADLPDAVRVAAGLPPLGAGGLPQRGDGDDARLPTLRELEEAHIRRVLTTERNMERAAAILGITTVTLWRKRKELGLE
ncbi:sigma-54 dependent transcriptional regulator [Nitratidesulfovibrio liaohensis]|uniref:Sigma-54 dependent transcriptional regulator n=2 Tax=Nitratidesulfovibrio liaohensis TaxID=2604158 RepID=A0ABY9R866_9BACT|nr:sigma-54 dependent transcriptional regulator [Nitratidesulfovibrio liaohensis]WMW67332.1 sigma-54 dependent transcriptional regulator [Nitratidesulfovibrio liaohensis]